MTNPRDTLNIYRGSPFMDTAMTGLVVVLVLPLWLALAPVLAVLWLVGRTAQKLGWKEY